MRRTIRFLCFLGVLCFLPVVARAQNFTVVTGTITDPNGLAYSNATVSAQLVPTGTAPTIGGAQISGFTRATANVSGTFSMTLGSNAVILPGGTQWQFTVNEAGIAPPAGTGSQSFSVTLTISGASQSVSAALSAAAPALSLITGGGGAVSSVFGRTGAVVATSGDYTCAQVTGCGSSVFPITVSGTVNSGGIPCFNSATNEQTSPLLVSGSPVIGGGASACPSSASGTQFGILDWLTGTTLGQACTPPAVNGYYPIEYVVTASATVQSTCPQSGVAGVAISGATSTYTVGTNLSDTVGIPINHDVAGSVANVVTLPTPTTLANTYPYVIYTNHSAFTDTIKATTWTIQEGAAAAVAGATGIPAPPGTKTVLWVDPFNSTQWLADQEPLNGGACSAAGSAANPSVAACGAYVSGQFSCATNASTGTCKVNSTAVTTTGSIFVQPDASATISGVTCNTTADTGLTAPRIASRVAATSFTINVGTFSTNPLCFGYWIKP